MQIALARHACAAVLVGAIALAAPSLHARAAEVSFLEGSVIGDVRPTDGRPWELQYLQEPIADLGVSFSYLNEAQYRTRNDKAPWHHARDGGAVQLWAMTPRDWLQPFQLAVGAGPYVYFDTYSEPLTSFDRHGVAEMYTGSLRYFTPFRGLFARLDLIEIHAPGGPDARILELGIGYQSRTTTGPSYGGPSPGESAALPYSSQFAVLAGRTGDSNWNATESNTYGVEYRQGIGTHLEVSGAWLSEGDGISGRHDGLVAQIWLTDRFFSPRFTLGIGAGPYVALRTHTAEDGQEAPRAQGVVAMTASFQIYRRWVARIIWDRAFTTDDQDRDIVLAGFAYSWNW